jgi:hypothetical protein
MERAQTLISVADFKGLLTNLKDRRPDICIRFRSLGEMWSNNFLSVYAVTERGVLLCDELNRRIIAVYDLNNIMQFELDRSFQGFQPFYHYDVHPVVEAAEHR